MNEPTILGTESELEARRLKVVRLRARRMSESQIARSLGVSEATVSRDLSWVRSNYQEMYGPSPKLDPGILIGESLALFNDVEATALLDAGQSDISVKNKMACLRTAMLAREHSVALLQDLGVIARATATVSVGLPTASQIRRALAAARLDPTQLTKGSSNMLPSADEIP